MALPKALRGRPHKSKIIAVYKIRIRTKIVALKKNAIIKLLHLVTIAYHYQ
jgi:hypothetical protein